jgi:hypothetical protein
MISLLKLFLVLLRIVMSYPKMACPQRGWSVFFVSLTVLTVMPADGAVARTRLQWLKDQQPPEKTVSVPPSKAEENTAPVGRPTFWLESLEAFNYEPAIRETVIDVQLLPREVPSLETTTEALQGLQTELNREAIWQYPTVNLREIQLELPDIRAAAEELRGTESEAFNIDDYIPEPTGQPLINVDMGVATVPDGRVQWRATLWSGVMTDNDLGEFAPVCHFCLIPFQMPPPRCGKLGPKASLFPSIYKREEDSIRSCGFCW